MCSVKTQVIRVSSSFNFDVKLQATSNVNSKDMLTVCVVIVMRRKGNVVRKLLQAFEVIERFHAGVALIMRFARGTSKLTDHTRVG